MVLGMHFDSFGSLCVPVPGLLVYLGIDSGLVEEVLGITLILDVYNSSLEVLCEGHILVAVYLSWGLSASSTKC